MRVDSTSLATAADVRVESLELFRAEDELDLEGLKVTLTNGTASTTALGASCDSNQSCTLDLSDF